jgi:thiol-disulfide isomerase/thioredoxin
MISAGVVNAERDAMNSELPNSLSSRGPNTEISSALGRPNPEWRPSYSVVSANEFVGIVGRNSNVVVHCWAIWNGYDAEAERRLLAAVADVPTAITLCAIDVDDEINFHWLSSQNLTNVPTLFFFKNGRRCHSIVGLRSIESLRSSLAEQFVTGNS